MDNQEYPDTTRPAGARRGPLPDHVARLAALVRSGEMTKRRAVDGLLDFWRLTRVGALDLLNKELGDA